jgi:hypothetical protein
MKQIGLLSQSNSLETKIGTIFPLLLILEPQNKTEKKWIMTFNQQ